MAKKRSRYRIPRQPLVKIDKRKVICDVLSIAISLGACGVQFKNNVIEVLTANMEIKIPREYGGYFLELKNINGMELG